MNKFDGNLNDFLQGVDNYLSNVFTIPYWGPLFVLLGVSVLVFATLLLICWLFSIVNTEQMKPAAMMLLVLSILGAVSGQIGGASREPAVGYIIPSFLGLAGGVAAYLFGLKDKDGGVFASLGFIAFSVTIFLGFYIGADARSKHEFNARRTAECSRLFFHPDTYRSAESWWLAHQDGRYKNCLKFLNSVLRSPP